MFNMKTLFYVKLRISAGMIENLKTRNITLIPATFRSTEMFKNVGISVIVKNSSQNILSANCRPTVGQQLADS